MKPYRRKPQYAVQYRNRKVHKADWIRTLFAAVETRAKPTILLGTELGIRFMRIAG